MNDKDKRLLELEKEIEKLKNKIDEITWSAHQNEGYISCGCDYCKRYRLRLTP